MKRTLCLFLALILAVGICFSAPVTITASAAVADLTVTIDTGASVNLKDADSDSYYDIGTADELYAFSAAVNGGNTAINGELTANITINENVLTADGELNGDGLDFRVWMPIGTTAEIYYIGTFDGGNNTVSGLYYNDSEYNGVGLFGYVGSGGKVENVGVIDSYLSGDMAVGGVAGSITSTIVINCYNTGTVKGSDRVGGVVGENSGGVDKCYNTGIVKGGDIIGGVVGYSSNAMFNCYNTGTIEGGDYVGGVVGYNSNGNVQNCYNTSNVRGITYVGGVVGGSSNEVTNCYFNAENFTGDAIGDSEESVTTNVGPKTVEQFASGEVAYLLESVHDEEFDGRVWGQKIGEDAFPVFATEGNKVYAALNCQNNTVYSNTQQEDGHHTGGTATCTAKAVCEACGASYGEFGDHTYKNGKCTVANCDNACAHETITDGVCVDCSGKHCGNTVNDKVVWFYDEAAKTLKISGIGAMADYSAGNTPWENYKSSIIQINIENGVTTIGDSAFYSCTSLESVIIPDSVTTIGDSSFFKCSALTEINIPASVTLIKTYAFANSESLVSINVDVNNNNYSSVEGVLFNKNKTELICYPAGKDAKSYTISDGVTTVGKYAFSACSALETVTFPQGITTIDSYAFKGCTALTSVTIPDSVTSIGDYAFYDCEKLASITIPKSVTSIGNFAFSGISTTATVNVPCSWKENPKYTTFANSIKVNIPAHECELGVCTVCKYDCTHENKDVNGICTVCYLAEGTCGENVTWIYDSKTTTLTISGTGAMTNFVDDNIPWENYKSSITQINIGNGVTTISDYAFGGCSKLKSITIPEKVTTIGKYAFSNCTKLTSVTIPDSVTSISASAFSGCLGLESVTIGNSVTSVGERAFINCSALTSVTFGESVTSLGNYAFRNCTSLASITLPEKVTISEGCFYDCTSLASVTIPGGVTIGEAAFSGCTSLTTVTLENSVETIGGYAFSNCTSLATVIIPESVTTIGSKAFGGCENVLLFVDKNNSDVQTYAINNSINYVVDGSGELGKLTFTLNADGESYSVTACDTTITGSLIIPSEYNGKPVTEIGYRAFANCENLTSVVIPDSVVSLGEMAFYVCGSLETVTLSSNISVIPNDAFAYCESLKTLPITENIENIGERAFYDSGEHGSVSLSGVTIGSEAFRSCGITELILENCELNDTDIFTSNDIEELVLLETDVPDEMFDGHAYIKTLVAEDSVLGANSFANCSELKSVTVSGGEINNDAFVDCSLLETVTIDNVDSVGEYAFNNCQNLKTIVLYTREISKYAFSMCTSLESVKLSDGVEVIGDAVFEGCTSLAELELPETVTKIGKRVFNGCNSLTELVIPESVTDVSAEAFAGCFNLKYVFFVGNEEDIGNEYIADAKIHYGSSTHTFNENYTVDLDPTCTEKGRESQHCKYCEETQNSKEIKELGHTSVNGGTKEAHTICDVCKEILSTTHNITSKVTTAPTCTEEGVETFTCECGYTYTKPVKALNHDLVSHAGKAATCTEKGYYPYNTCSRCDYTTYKEDAAKGHNIVKDSAVAPTCTTSGKTEGSHCTRCNGATVAQREVAALGHKLTLVGKKDATFEADGHTGAEVCSVCNKTINAGSVIPKLTFTTPVVTAVANNNGIKVNWNNVENAQSYVLYKRVFDATSNKWSKWEIIKTDLTNFEYLDSDVVLGTKYRYTVRAKNGDTLSPYKTTTTVKYNVTPTVKVANASNGIKVSWSTATNATGYRVYRSTLSNGKWSDWKNMGTAKANKTSWIDKSVKSNVTYKYTVRAVYNKVLSSYNKAGASVLFLTTPTVKIANSASGIKVSWNKITGATGYYVYSSQFDPATNKWSKWVNRGTVTKTNWTDTTVKSGETYKYTVRAINGKTLSAYKGIAGLIYLAQPTVKIANASNGIKVSWNKVDGVTGYTVYSSTYDAKTKKWSSWKNRGTAKADKTSWVDKNVKSGVKYKYTVRAVNGKTKSTYVSSGALIYLAQPIVTVKSVSNGINVSWTQCAGSTGYTVYRSELVNGEWSKWTNMGTAKSDKKSWTDKKAKKGVTYKYTVRAVNGKVKSSYKASSLITK